MVIRLTPYGVLALMTRVVATSNVIDVINLGTFVVASYVGMAHHPADARRRSCASTGISPVRFYQKIWPLLTFAFTSRSSGAAIPLSIDTQVTRLGVAPAIANFAASFGATIGQNACAGLYPAMLAVMIAPSAGIDPTSLSFLASLVGVATLGSFGIAGVGGGATFAALVVLSTLNLPVALAGLLISVEPLIDMGRTAVNVSGSVTAGHGHQPAARPDRPGGVRGRRRRRPRDRAGRRATVDGDAVSRPAAPSGVWVRCRAARQLRLEAALKSRPTWCPGRRRVVRIALRKTPRASRRIAASGPDSIARMVVKTRLHPVTIVVVTLAVAGVGSLSARQLPVAPREGSRRGAGRAAVLSRRRRLGPGAGAAPRRHRQRARLGASMGAARRRRLPGDRLRPARLRAHHVDPDGPPGTAADDLKALTDALGLDRFHLVGTAAGGIVAIDFALAFPDRLRSLVVANSLGGVTDASYVALGQRLRPKEFAALPPDLRELGPGLPGRRSRRAPIAGWRWSA